MLVSAGFAVNERDGTGCVPLHWAAQRGNKDAVDALIELGADANAIDWRNDKPIALTTKAKIRRLLAPLLRPVGHRNGASAGPPDGLQSIRFFDEQLVKPSLPDMAAAVCWNKLERDGRWLARIPLELSEKVRKVRTQKCAACRRACAPVLSVCGESSVTFWVAQLNSTVVFQWRERLLFCSHTCAQVPFFHSLFQRAVRLEGSAVLVLNFGDGGAASPTLASCYQDYQDALALLAEDASGLYEDELDP